MTKKSFEDKFERGAAWFLRWPSLISVSALFGAMVGMDHNLKDQKPPQPLVSEIVIPTNNGHSAPEIKTP